jgi:hypothetical protein
MLLQRETTAVAIVTIKPRSLCDKALRPPDMIGEAAGSWQEARCPLHVDCGNSVKSPYNSLAHLPAGQSARQSNIPAASLQVEPAFL